MNSRAWNIDGLQRCGMPALCLAAGIVTHQRQQGQPQRYRMVGYGIQNFGKHSGDLPFIEDLTRSVA